MEQADVVVIGAGVVGLAVARRLARAGREVLILEREKTFGSGISSRNSEVIHAGIYYPLGSLKARLCVSGQQALYAFCLSHGVAHRRCGKLLVATDESQMPKLTALQAQAQANGVADLEPLTGSEARALEPQLHCVAALLSPSTGIIDSHGLMLSLLAEAENAGALLALNCPVLSGEAVDSGLLLRVGGDEPSAIQASTVINCAGLGAVTLARNLTGIQLESLPPFHLAKGNYFALAGKAPFSHLIYPMPEAAGLGVHLTLDLAGQARFGPDVEWLDQEDYRVDPQRGIGFYHEIRRYWPELPDGALQPAYAGIRPKLQGPAGRAMDFVLQTETEHGVPGLINLFGIESPGLTSCLALADEVFARL